MLVLLLSVVMLLSAPWSLIVHVAAVVAVVVIAVLADEVVADVVLDGRRAAVVPTRIMGAEVESP